MKRNDTHALTCSNPVYGMVSRADAGPAFYGMVSRADAGPAFYRMVSRADAGPAFSTDGVNSVIVM